MELITELSEGSHAKKEKHIRWLRKMARKGRLLDIIQDPNWKQKATPEAIKEVSSRDWIFRLSNALLYLGDYSWWGWEHRSAWGEMCWGNPAALKLPFWQGQAGRMLLLGEQGLGDEIMFSSCIPDLQNFDLDITYMCDARLETLMQRSFGVKTIPRVINLELKVVHERLQDFDFYFPLGELPRFFRQSAKEFPGVPFLVPDPKRQQDMGVYAGRTGVSWRGRNGFYPSDEFPEGLSLQYDQRWDEDAERPNLDMVKDIEGLVALVSVLKNVRCVSTSVAHIAGAVGTPTDVILAPIETRHPENMINWRWRGGASHKSPWYSSIRIWPGLRQWNVSGLKEWSAQNEQRDL